MSSLSSPAPSQGPHIVSVPASNSTVFNSEGALGDLSALKREVARLQEEVRQRDALSKQKRERSSVKAIGRGLPRVVTMFKSVISIVSESDCRIAADDGMDMGADDPVEEAEEQARNRDFNSYKALTKLLPKLETVLADPDVEKSTSYLGELQTGANDARADDVRRIKEELANWLNSDYRTEIGADDLFDPKTRSGRGFQNDITGRLLCPIALDWKDPAVRVEIRNGASKHDINNDFFLTVLFPRAILGHDDSLEGFLKSELLLKTFLAVFKSPSSVGDVEEDPEEGPVIKKRKGNTRKQATKRCVAELVHMDEVTPRAIAFAATLLVFNLMDASQWPANGVHNGFDLHALYNFVIDYLEVDIDEDSRKTSKDVIAWWNRRVFPDQTTNKSNSDAAWKAFLVRRTGLKRMRRNTRRYPPGLPPTPVTFADSGLEASGSNTAPA